MEFWNPRLNCLAALWWWPRPSGSAKTRTCDAGSWIECFVANAIIRSVALGKIEMWSFNDQYPGYLELPYARDFYDITVL